ncbi:hypothetical protein [Herbaspirillum aquaticum]|nr:hypothetical protein [Herbaspirillum aquaticum]
MLLVNGCLLKESETMFMRKLTAWLLTLVLLAGVNSASAREHTETTLLGPSYTALKEGIDKGYAYVIFPSLYRGNLAQTLYKKGIVLPLPEGLGSIDETLQAAILKSAKDYNLAFDAYDVAEIGLIMIKQLGVAEQAKSLISLLNLAVGASEQELQAVDSVTRLRKREVLQARLIVLIKEINDPFRLNQERIQKQIVELVGKNTSYYATPNVEKLDIRGFKMEAPFSDVSAVRGKNAVEKQTLAQDAVVSELINKGQMSGTGFLPFSQKGPSVQNGVGGATVQDGPLSLFYTCDAAPSPKKLYYAKLQGSFGGTDKLTRKDITDSLIQKYGQPTSGNVGQNGNLVLIWGSSWPSVYLGSLSFRVPVDRLEANILESSYTLELVSRKLEKEQENCRKKDENAEHDAAKRNLKF